MKKITCIQQYVIDNLIKDEILSTNRLLGAVSKVCIDEIAKKLKLYGIIIP